MKFTASEIFNTYTIAAGKDITWNCYFRASSSLAGTLTDSNWTNLTDQVTEFSEPKTKIEYQVGSFTADSISITGLDIQFWRTYVFNSTNVALNIEFKLTAQVNDSEIVIPFSGFADIDTIEYEEETDSVKFKVNTSEVMGGKIQAYNINTQYLDDVGRLILPNIPGVYVYDASDSINSGAKPLKRGIHTIHYKFVDGDTFGTLALDNGREIILDTPDMFVTLGDLSDTDILVNINDTQNLVVCVIVSELSTYPCEFQDTVIVTNTANQVPQQPYYGLSLKEFITLVYSKIGITTVNYDDFTIPTYNSKLKYSPLEAPINTVGRPTAICGIGTNMLIGVGRYLYRRATAYGTYSQIYDLGSDAKKITRILYNQRNNEAMLFVRDGSTTYLYLGTLSGAYSPYHTWTIGTALITSAGDVVSEEGVCFVDYNYTGTSWKYGIAYRSNSSSGSYLHYIDASTYTDTKFYNNTIVINWTSNMWVDTISPSQSSNGKYNIVCSVTTPTHRDKQYIGFVSIDTSGNFSTTGVIGGTTFTTPFTILQEYKSPFLSNQIMNHSNGYIYYLYNNNIVASPWESTNSTITTVQPLDDTYSIASLHEDAYTGTSYIYMYVTTTVKPNNSLVYKIYSTGIVGDTIELLRPMLHGTTSMGGNLYITDYTCTLGTLTTNVTPYIDVQFNYTEMSIRDLINTLLKAYNLVSIINSYKTVTIYRRGDGSGVPINSGNTLSLTTNEVGSIAINKIDYAGFDIVAMTTTNNGSTNYDGTIYDVGSFSDTRIITIDTKVVPVALIKEVCALFWEFFSVDRILYTVECGCQPYFQYEPLDRCVLTLPDTKVGVSDAGIIYSAIYKQDGSTTLSVLI